MKNKKLKIARMERDMNQEELAKAVGVTRQTISMIESGNYNPTLNLCLAICHALGKTLDDIFWQDERKDDTV
ncbi:MAG: helix-turn-helix transcriptional regulator [Ruminococcus sp.]|nr:helix-turn-helix transcriptional regulator [Ruminococcus sp.]